MPGQREKMWGSFWGRDHFRINLGIIFGVGDQFGVGIISGALQDSCYRETWLVIIQSEYSIFSSLYCYEKKQSRLREHRPHLWKWNTEKKPARRKEAPRILVVLSSLSLCSRRFLSIFLAARWNKLLISYTRSHFRSLHVLLQINASQRAILACYWLTDNRVIVCFKFYH